MKNAALIALSIGRNRIWSGLLIVCTLLFLLPTGAMGAGNTNAFELRDGDRVVLLGDTLIEREQAHGHIEYLLTTHAPNRNVTFRNLGWSADTPLGASRAGFDTPEKGFDRLKEQLALVKPTVAILGYGMTASFDGEAGLEGFKADMIKLMETVEQNSPDKEVRFILLSPIPHEPLPKPAADPARHNAQLALYSKAVEELALARKGRFVDLFRMLARTNLPPNVPLLTDNGIHPTEYGYRLIAQSIGRGLNWEAPIWRMGILADGKLRPGSWGAQLLNIELKPDRLKLEFQTEQLVSPPAPNGAPPPFTFAGANRLQVSSMTAGQYDLLIDGRLIKTLSGADLKSSTTIDTGPQYDQAEELRRAIARKNELFFHRYRPQNNTYLFLFRKHEQGQNAKEIPQFDPLIEQQEKLIADLRKPRKHMIELVPTTIGRKPDVRPKESPALTIDQTPLPHPQFDLGDNLEINLYAENPLLAKPIHMNFDAQGRLWVASSEVYPQIKPGQAATDKILVLEDTNGDGRAEKSTVFADGLLIPTGVEPGDGGVYVGQSTELLHLKDTDGDGRADERRVVLSAFGTEDTHHILHTLRWGHDGQLYMNQSIYIHTHAETPHGVTRLNSGGILNLRTGTGELGIHMKGLVNSWGHAIDRYGQSFATDGASSADAWRGGLNWVIPQAMFLTYERSRRILDSISPGSYPKFCGLEYLRSTHFPEEWQGSFVTCDFRAHRIVRFGIEEKDSAYVTKEMPDLVRTKDVAFRPIDIKVGPDGALYIADWSNPIIQHGEVDFRDPRRDHEHGRIWRVTHKNRPLVAKKDFTRLPHSDLLDQLNAQDDYTVRQARRALLERNSDLVLRELNGWTKRQTNDSSRLEALWMYQGLDVVERSLLEQLLKSSDARVRAAAVRVLAFWQERRPGREGGTSSPELITRAAAGWPSAPLPLPHREEIPSSQALELLAGAIVDPHPRVRVEALRALARIPEARSAELALAAVDKPLDKYLDYTLWMTVNDLARPWLAAVKSGQWKSQGREKQLEFALKSIEPGLASEVLGLLLGDQSLPRDGSGPWIDILGQAGTAKELRRLFDQVIGNGFDPSGSARALAALGQAARLRNVRPTGDLTSIAALFDAADERIRVEAIRLAGPWKLSGDAVPKLAVVAGAPNSSPALREAAFSALRERGGSQAIEALSTLSGKSSAAGVRRQAVLALAALNFDKAVAAAVELIVASADEAEALDLWRPLLSIKRAAPILAKALPKTGIPPSAAKAGLRAAREGGRNEPDLILALTRGAGLEEGEVTLTEAELKQLAADVAAKGDPARGEIVYRRKELSCVACHAIGGSGGKVGPDMTSIGASAPLDYLIESVWFPNKKIKEGFHALAVETKDGEELSGVLVRENNQSIVLRDATAKETEIPKNNIVSRRIGTLSLMPAGLIDGLSGEERIDLFRFLSELGKPGPFDATKGNIARTWHLRPGVHTIEQFGEDKFIATPLSDRAWATVYSRVNGQLTPEDIRAGLTVGQYLGLTGVYAATRLQTPKQGTVNLKPTGKVEAIWIDGKALATGQSITAELPAGTHTIVLRIDPKKLNEPLRLEASEGVFLTE